MSGTSAMDSWVSSAQTIPSFTFNSTVYTTAFVNSNGFITLGGSAPSMYTTTGVSSPGGSGISISPFGADLDRATLTVSTEIRWQTVGNEIIFQWQQIKRYGATESFDMQVRLNTSNSNVVFVYQLNSGPGASTSYFPQVGIRTSTTDYNNRLVASGTENWATSLVGSSNTSTCRFTSTAPAKGFTTGLTYTFTPPVILTPPNCATLVSPADAGTGFLPSATLNWASGGGAPTGYKLYFGAGSLPGTFTDLGNVTTYNPTPDLNYSTTYYWKVVPYNVNGDATGCSTWSFTTGPDPTISSFPYTENFEGTTFPSYGWSEIRTPASSYGWISYATGYTGKCGRFDSYNNPDGNISNLVSPTINLTSLTTARLRFMFKNPTGDDFSVLLSTDGGATYPNVIWSGLIGQSTWLEKTADITSFIGSNVKIAFQGTSNYGNGDAYVYLDDVIIEEIPATPVFAITPLLKDFGTVISGSSSAAQVFTISNPGGGTLTITSGGISLTGANASDFTLTNANTYPINLGPGATATVSVAFTPASSGSKTANLQIVHNATGSPSTVALTGNALPAGTLFESFEGTTFPPLGWSVDASTWTQATFSGYDGTKSAYYSTSSVAVTDKKLITPKVAIASGNSLTYYAKTGSGTTQTIQVRYSADKVTWTDIGTPVTLTTTFTQYIVDLTSLAGNNYYLAFAAASTSTYVSFYVDFVLGPVIALEVPGPAIIGAPANAATNIELGTTLSWSPGSTGGIPTGYKLYFGTDGLGVTTPTNLVNGTLQTSPYTPTATLTYSTTYYWQIVPTNGVGDATGCPIWSFTTGPNPTITTFPYNQGFEGTAFPPYGWSVVDNNSDLDKWISSTVNPKTGTQCARIYTDYNAANDDYLVTPPVLLSGNQELKFWVRAHSVTETDEISILLSTTTPDPAAFTTILMPSTPVNTLTYVEYTVDLSAYTGTVYLSFTRKDAPADGWYLYLDDVLIRDIPSCLEPSALVVNNLTLTSANLQWTETGTATAWEYVYGVSPLPAPTGAGTATTSNTVNPISPLTANTTYQFYVRANCGGTYSTWVGPVSFYTGYCLPVGGITYYLTNVTTTGGTSNINNTTTASTGGYIDYSASISCTVPQSSAVTISLTPSSGTNYFYVWIDWNNDFDFADAGETIAATTTYTSTFSTSYTVTQAVGSYRMRVANSWSGAITPCGPAPNGEYEDYTFNVVAPLPTGTVSGTVTDCYTTTPISGATVTLGTLTTTTNASGFYEFTSVTIGTYTLSGSFTGYNTKTITGVTVLANQTTTQNFCLGIYLDPPVSLQATVTGQDVHLTWHEPGYVPSTEELIYDDDITTGGYSYEGATMSIHMSPQAPCKILSLKYYTSIQTGDNTFNAEVYNWDEIAETPGTTLLYQVGATAVDDNWMEIDISSQNITVSGDFVVGFGSINATTFLGYDGDLDNGRSWDYAEGAWSSWTESYLIRAIVEYGDGSRQMLIASPNINSKHTPITNLQSKLDVLSGKLSTDMQLTATNKSGGQISNSTHRAITPINNKAIRFDNSNNRSLEITENGRAPMSTLTGYNVYRDNVEIAHNTALVTKLYNDLNRPAGIYSYTVTAQYLEGESGPAGPAVVEVITCEAPINLTTDVTTNSAVLSWTPQGDATLWNLEWGPVGFVQGTGNMLSLGNPTTTLNSLTSGNQYDFYVRSYCGSTDQSAWVGPKTFRTHFFNCPAGSVSEAEACGGNTNGGCTMTTPAYEAITLGTTICGTGYFNGSIRDTDWFTFTPTVTTDVSLTASADFDVMIGFIAAPCPNVTFAASATALAGLTATVNYQLVAGTTYNVVIVPQFTGVFDCGSGDRYQLTLTGTTCLRATGLTATNITTSSADLSWTSPGIKWSIEYGEAGFVQGTSGGTIVEDITTPSFPLTGLVGSTSYTYYVMTQCDGGETSLWSLPYTFNTACVAFTLPYTENFDAVTTPAIPACMSVTNDNADAYQWITSTCDPYSGSNSMYMRWNSAADMDDWFFTPAFDLEPGTYNVSFWYNGSGTTFPEKLEVKWGSTANAAGMTNGPIFTNGNITNEVYTEGTGVITVTTAGTYYVGWHGFSDADMYYLVVDDISIVSAAPPTKTLNLTNVRLEHLFVEGTGGLMNQAYNASGPEYVAPTADVITVELHDAATYATILRTYPGVHLSQSGTASVSGIDLPDGNYRITIKHRNSIETTSVLVDFTGATVAYSFGTAASAYGNNLKLIDGFYCILGGDVDQNGSVELYGCYPDRKRSNHIP